MQPYTTDTSADAEAVQLELIRNMAPWDRVNKAIRMTTRLIRECKAAIRRNHPEFTETEVGIAFIALNYGQALADEVQTHLSAASRAACE